MDEDISSDESIECEDVQIDYSHLTEANPPDPTTLKKANVNKPKRVVEIRASKGRVLRYLKLPKAVDFMSPDLTEYFSEAQRHNLFMQLKDNKD
ncbi:Apoptosis-antagonizing transcription factor C-terminal [Paragonimus heterotremus]|uniref:Apoptosis-antagonizing transcription factor C-terminal n=1 Tax=Paragonimus heterotremus TaxID=100268 RepID=A0A8J4T4L3_9TREM|nr:Apoptosis-antagonizing transcription factor C-terminal [Paragonimus heterotremus]